MGSTHSKASDGADRSLSVRHRNGEVRHGITRDVLREMVQRRKLHPLDELSKDGGGHWVPAWRVHGLFPEDFHDALKAAFSKGTDPSPVIQRWYREGGVLGTSEGYATIPLAEESPVQHSTATSEVQRPDPSSHPQTPVGVAPSARKSPSAPVERSLGKRMLYGAGKDEISWMGGPKGAGTGYYLRRAVVTGAVVLGVAVALLLILVQADAARRRQRASSDQTINQSSSVAEERLQAQMPSGRREREEKKKEIVAIFEPLGITYTLTLEQHLDDHGRLPEDVFKRLIMSLKADHIGGSIDYNSYRRWKDLLEQLCCQPSSASTDDAAAKATGLGSADPNAGSSPPPEDVVAPQFKQAGVFNPEEALRRTADDLSQSIGAFLESGSEEAKTYAQQQCAFAFRRSEVKGNRKGAIYGTFAMRSERTKKIQSFDISIPCFKVSDQQPRWDVAPGFMLLNSEGKTVEPRDYMGDNPSLVRDMEEAQYTGSRLLVSVIKDRPRGALSPTEESALKRSLDELVAELMAKQTAMAAGSDPSQSDGQSKFSVTIVESQMSGGRSGYVVAKALKGEHEYKVRVYCEHDMDDDGQWNFSRDSEGQLSCIVEAVDGRPVRIRELSDEERWAVEGIRTGCAWYLERLLNAK